MNEQNIFIVRCGEVALKGMNKPYFERMLRQAVQAAVAPFSGRTERGDGRYFVYGISKENISQAMEAIKKVTIHPTDEVQEYLASVKQDRLNAGVSGADFLKRPRVTFDAVEKLSGETLATDRYVKEQVEIALKYEGYIKKEKTLVDRLHRLESKKIPVDIDYNAIPSLATEARQKFEKIRPESIAQAERISGVNPADLAILTAYIQQGRIAKVKNK